MANLIKSFIRIKSIWDLISIGDMIIQIIDLIQYLITHSL